MKRRKTDLITGVVRVVEKNLPLFPWSVKCHDDIMAGIGTHVGYVVLWDCEDQLANDLS